MLVWQNWTQMAGVGTAYRAPANLTTGGGLRFDCVVLSDKIDGLFDQLF